MIVIRGGEVLTPDGWVTTDVGIVGDRVERLGPGLDGERVIVADGCLVGPGFVDLHTHLRDPGQTWKEDMTSGSAAAAAGGFTAITAMPNTEPAMDDPQAVATVMEAARRHARVDVIPSAALTVDRAGTTPVDVATLYDAGVRLFTDDGDSLADPEVLEGVMTSVAALPGAFVAQHAEDTRLTRGGHMHEGDLSRRLGVGGLPSRAESEVVARDLELVARTGARYHCQHVSAQTTVDLIAAAREAGLPVTAEVTPHHLIFDESSVEGLDADFKMYPPLRSPGDRDALVSALRVGTIDAVATDHAPHLPEEKAAGFATAPRGVIGLETAAAAAWESLADRDRLFAAMSSFPARLLGLPAHGRPVEPGGPANLVVFDPAASWQVTRFESKSSNSPFKGREMTGQVKATLCRGQVVHESAVAVA